jgi:uncharacterized membrane protein
MSLTQFLLIVHLLSIAFMLGIGLSNIVGFRVAKGLGGDMAKGIASHREALIPYGDIFFVTILASGLLLLSVKYNMQVPSPWFHVKMAAVLIWVVCYVLMRLRVRKFLASRDMSLVPRIRMFAHIVLTAVVAAIICAVMAFAA